MKKAILAGLAFFLASSTAYAQDVRYEILQRHFDDQPAQMRVIAQHYLKNVKVSIGNCGTSKIVRDYPEMPASTVEMIEWKQPAGSYQCNIDITGENEQGGHLQVHDSQKFQSVTHLTMNMNLRDLSPDLNEITLRPNRPIRRATVEVFDEEGQKIDSVDNALKEVREVTVKWTPNGKKPALIDIKIEDKDGIEANYTVFYFAIPHTDIVFDTGKSDIRADQSGYLQESLDKINEVVGKYQRVAADLYITGYTDTVGAADLNEKLSLNRARSIAQWFRDHGCSLTMYYRGAGERGLAVPTPDETPEEKNRRAVYILTNRPPVETNSLGNWTKL